MHAGIFGLILVIVLIMGSMIMGPSAGQFFHIPSLAISVGVPLGLGLMSFGLHDLSRALASLRVVIARPNDQGYFARSAVVLRQLISYVYSAGVVGTMIGWIQMLNAGVPPEHVPRGLAVSILTIFYAIIICESIFRPAARQLENEVSR